MTTLKPPATIAFIGLGMMGRPMATRLAEAGFKLRLYDLSQKAVSDFIGAHPSALARPGETFIVPKVVWHRGIVTAPGRLTFITPGAGTEHKPV